MESGTLTKAANFLKKYCEVFLQLSKICVGVTACDFIITGFYLIKNII